MQNTAQGANENVNRKTIMFLHIICPITAGALIYCLAAPNMMWGYSLVFALFRIIGNTAASIWKVFWVAFPFSAVMEMVQKASFFPGTFDVFDIAVEFLTEIIAACIIYKLYSREEL